METVFGNTYLDIIPFFDRVYSFDRKDVEAHANLNYLPLFYCETYEQLANATPAAVHDIDLLFIGTLWELRRYDYLKRLIDICAIHDIRFHHYLRCSCRLYCRTLMKGRVLKDVRFRSLGQRDIVEYFRRTRVVIDLPHLFQTGLTMRVFEALGAGRRLITTNKYIRQEPFYDDQYISIIDPDSLAIDVDFVKQATIRRNPKIEEYSISNWLKTLFAGKQ
jgi:spore maturation protein CgeB